MRYYPKNGEELRPELYRAFCVGALTQGCQYCMVFATRIARLIGNLAATAAHSRSSAKSQGAIYEEYTYGFPASACTAFEGTSSLDFPLNDRSSEPSYVYVY